MMKNSFKIACIIGQLFFSVSCGQTELDAIDEVKEQVSATAVTFVDEFVLPDSQEFENTLVGGLSGIDYKNGTWVAISDDSKQPRFYTLDIAYDLSGFQTLKVIAVATLKEKSGQNFEEETVDSESIRIVNDNRIVWSSEGNINAKIDPFVRVASIKGDFTDEMNLPQKYGASENEKTGPVQNGVFEGLSLSADDNGYWVNTELPLKEDGRPPSVNEGALVRIAYIDKATGEFGKEFAYPLDPVVQPAINGFSFELNGLVELLEYQDNKFLALERSFSAGYADGGNTVKLYAIDATNATDVRTLESLEKADVLLVKKKLLLNFDTLRPQLTNGIVDNLEGITFGPKFSNGNRSIVVVSDNNFSRLYNQLNQFILLELQE